MDLEELNKLHRQYREAMVQYALAKVEGHPAEDVQQASLKMELARFQWSRDCDIWWEELRLAPRKAYASGLEMGWIQAWGSLASGHSWDQFLQWWQVYAPNTHFPPEHLVAVAEYLNHLIQVEREQA